MVESFDLMVMLILLISPCLLTKAHLNTIKISYIEVENVASNWGANSSDEFSTVILCLKKTRQSVAH